MRYLSRTRGLALTALILATVQTIEAVRYLGEAQYLSVLLFMAAFFAALASLKIWRDNCFGSRFTLAIIAAFVVVGHTLSLTAGLPGSMMNTRTGGHGTFGFISVAMAIVILGMLLPHFFRNYGETRSRSSI